MTTLWEVAKVIIGREFMAFGSLIMRKKRNKGTEHSLQKQRKLYENKAKKAQI